MSNVRINSKSDKLMPVPVQNAVKAKFSHSNEKELTSIFKNGEWDIYNSDGKYLTSFDTEGNEL